MILSKQKTWEEILSYLDSESSIFILGCNGCADVLPQDQGDTRLKVNQALYRQGLCYVKKQDEAQAKAIFETLVSQYSDQTRIINEIKPMLEELSNSDPASLMPAATS